MPKQKDAKSFINTTGPTSTTAPARLMSRLLRMRHPFRTTTAGLHTDLSLCIFTFWYLSMYLRCDPFQAIFKLSLFFNGLNLLPALCNMQPVHLLSSLLDIGAYESGLDADKWRILVFRSVRRVRRVSRVSGGRFGARYEVGCMLVGD